MKKLMTMMLGLALFVGATAIASADDAKTTTKTTKAKKTKKVKKTTTAAK
jgi:hypothetical protein